MNRCPDCKNEFLQPFVCTTCGAQKLYDTTVVTLQNQLAAAIEQRDKTRNDALEEAAKICDEYANVGVVGARICAAAICATKEFGAHIKEMHEFIEENRRLIENHDLANTQSELSAAIAQRDKAMEWVRGTLGTAHLKEMDDYIKEECGK